MGNESEKNKVLSALESGDYKMSFVTSNCISKGTKYDGKEFYVFANKDEKPDVNLGSCSVEVSGHLFVYDLNFGHWHGDCAPLYADKDVQQALEKLPHFCHAAEYDNHAQWHVYTLVNHLDENLPYYWYSEAPKDVKQLKGGSVEIPARYDYNIVPGAAKPQYRVLCYLNFADLAALYPILQGHNVDLMEENLVRLPGNWIEEVNPKLYNRVLNAVQKGIIDKGDVIASGRMCIALRLTREIYEEYLG